MGSRTSIPIANMQDANTAYQHALTALQKHDTLSKGITELSNNCAPSETLNTTVLELQNELADLKQSLDYFHKRHFAAQLKAQSASVVAQKTFDIPELLELIFTFLPVPSLLAAQQVSRQFSSTVASSTKLQRRLGLLPHEDTDLYFPIQRFTRIDIEGDYERYVSQRVPGQKILLKFQHYFPEHVRRVGARIRAMLICQPPIKQLDIFPDCCQGRFNDSRVGPRTPIQTVMSETGITVGDIIDVIKKDTAEHKRCPLATPWAHDKKGFVELRVVCEAEIAVRADEPLLIEKQKAIEHNTRKANKGKALMARINPYIAAKQRAHHFGGYIPTLAEFEAEQERKAGAEAETEEEEDET